MISIGFLKGKGAGRLFVVFASALFLVFTGCESKKKESSTEVQTEAPVNHSATDVTESMAQAAHAVRPPTREINVSEEVRNKWKEVQLQITDTSRQQTQLLTLQIGTSVRLNDEGERLGIEIYIPDYAIADKQIESRSNEPNNPAVFVNLTHEGKVLKSGWVFMHLPEYNSFVHKRFHLVLVGPGGKQPAE
jgi:hypothetical protein